LAWAFGAAVWFALSAAGGGRRASRDSAFGGSKLGSGDGVGVQLAGLASVVHPTPTDHRGERSSRVRAAAVVGVPGARLGERIGAAIVSVRSDWTLEELGRTVTGAGLSRHKQPELFRVVPALPTNATGKINKKALLELFGPEVSPGVAAPHGAGPDPNPGPHPAPDSDRGT
jgi:hypothetical protein